MKPKRSDKLQALEWRLHMRESKMIILAPDKKLQLVNYKCDEPGSEVVSLTSGSHVDYSTDPDNNFRPSRTR